MQIPEKLLSKYFDKELSSCQSYRQGFDGRLRSSVCFKNDTNWLSIVKVINWASSSELKGLKEEIEEGVKEIEKELTGIEQLQDRRKQSWVNAGYSKEAIKENLHKEFNEDLHMSSGQKKFQLLGRLHALRLEIDFVSEAIEGLEQKTIKKIPPLKHGCRGNSAGHPDRKNFRIDHQKCSIVLGQLTIIDEGSPYQGMRVSDYRKYIVPEFKETGKVPGWPAGVKKNSKQSLVENVVAVGLIILSFTQLF